MAHINVRRKRKPIWPFLFTLMLLALVAAGGILIFSRKGNSFEDKVSGVKEDFKTQKDKVSQKMEQNEDKVMSSDKKDQPEAVKQFVSFAEDSVPKQGQENRFASEGLDKLAVALKSVQEKKNLTSGNIDQSISTLKDKSEKLQTDASGKALKDAFSSAASAIENVQKEGFPDNNDRINDLKSEVNKVSEGEKVSEQKVVVQDFLNESADAVESFASARE